jgi:hypothetical protein
MKGKLTGGVKDGVSYAEPLGQKKPRGEVEKGQLPKKDKGSVKTDHGTFKMA